MKQRLLLLSVSTLLVGVAWSAWVVACDHDKNTSAASSDRTTASVASTSSCSAHSLKNTSTASSECGAHGAAVKTASSSECGAHGASMKTASSSECGAHGASMKTAGAACKVNGATTASNEQCFGKGMLTVSDASIHSDCDACADMATCANSLSQNAAHTQVLPLKNGVMFVYTTDTPSHVRSIQTAMARRTEHLLSLTSAGDRAKLCPECKTVRGAIASGKLNRETVNIEGGCLTLMTSNDPAMVAKLRRLVASNSAHKS
jgi:hypothetical protein